MKALRRHLKQIALFLAVIFLMQSCKVYTYKSITLEEAVKFDYNKVKVKSRNNKTYRFDKLEKKDGVHYGTALKNSKTAKKLSDQITYKDEFSYVKILIKEHQLREVYVKEQDKTWSRILSFGLPTIIIGGIIWIDSLGGVGISGFSSGI